jgi:hypothetical protein
MPTTTLIAAAGLLSELVPRTVPHLRPSGVVAELGPLDYAELSNGERAAYELARDLWNGDGPLARYLIYADAHYANVLLSALTVALGPVLVELP